MFIIGGFTLGLASNVPLSFMCIVLFIMFCGHGTISQMGIPFMPTSKKDQHSSSFFLFYPFVFDTLHLHFLLVDVKLHRLFGSSVVCIVEESASAAKIFKSVKI